MKARSLFLLGIGVLLGVLLIALVSTRAAPSPEFQGSLINPPVPATDFLLTDQQGMPFRLSDQRGKVVLVFFGYTFCPDVCPATLVDFKWIQNELGDRAGEVQFVFITVDPQRDTAAQLKTHLAAFSPAFIGLRGDPEVLSQVWQAYGVSPEIRPGAGVAGYLVDHAARVFVIDRRGNLRLTFPFGLGAEAMYLDVVQLLDEPSGP